MHIIIYSTQLILRKFQCHPTSISKANALDHLLCILCLVVLSLQQLIIDQHWVHFCVSVELTFTHEPFDNGAASKQAWSSSGEGIGRLFEASHHYCIIILYYIILLFHVSFGSFIHPLHLIASNYILKSAISPAFPKAKFFFPPGISFYSLSL